MAQIDYFFSVLSPFTYLAGDQLEKIAKARGATIVYKPANLMEVFAETGGVPPAKRHPSRQEYRLQELKRISKRAGLPLNLKPAHWPTDGTPASQAIIAVQEAGGDAGAMARAVLRSVWADEKDIGDTATVDALLRETGNDPTGLESAIAGALAAFEANTKEALERGVFGAPFYIVGDERFWGQDRLDYLDDYLATLA